MTNSTITKINALVACPGRVGCTKQNCACYSDETGDCHALGVLSMFCSIITEKVGNLPETTSITAESMTETTPDMAKETIITPETTSELDNIDKENDQKTQ